MHWTRRWARGFNQSELIAQAFAQTLSLPTAHLLKRDSGPPQTSVTLSRRPANVRNKVAPLRLDLTGWVVLLIDDVKTTGSTLTECVKALSTRGAAHVDVIVAAVAERHRGQPHT